MGLVLLTMALLMRLERLSEANLVGDDLAIIASLLVVLVGITSRLGFKGRARTIESVAGATTRRSVARLGPCPEGADRGVAIQPGDG